MTCEHCGGPASQTYAFLCGRGGQSQRVPMGRRCDDADCRRRQRAAARADQAAWDEAAIRKAVEAGVIDA